MISGGIALKFFVLFRFEIRLIGKVKFVRVFIGLRFFIFFLFSLSDNGI